MPVAKDPTWIDWRSSAAREILLEDLELGGYLFEQDHVPVGELFKFYKTFPEFELVVFSQFEVRIENHWKSATKRINQSRLEAK